MARIQARPERYVAQEQVGLSEAPVFLEDRLESRCILMRVFVTTDGERGYRVMPGALTRVAQSKTSHSVSMQHGGGSKDTWVEAATYREHVSLLGPQSGLTLNRSHHDLPSRVADNLFWLGRYAERSESTARLYRGVISRLTQERGGQEAEGIRPALMTLAAFGQSTWQAGQPLTREWVAPILCGDLLDARSAGSLRGAVEKLHGIAATVRDRISTDTWRILHQLEETLCQGAGEQGVSGRQHPATADQLLLLNKVILSLSAFNGMVAENMTQSLGWCFLELGRKTERAIYSARLVEETLREEGEQGSPALEVLLEIFDSIITYRQKYFILQAEAVMELVLSDEENPRSLIRQLRRIQSCLCELPQGNQPEAGRAEEKMVERALSQMGLLEFGESKGQEGAERGRLVEQLARVEACVQECANLVALRYFSHLRPSSAGQKESFQREVPATERAVM
ncbi:MAG: circularly permuted type 2 ATP-grasp protein [Blastochloris sp.]|nr:circularly permuted type 2 ATP-grasp protein [Blastochloris sp.]